MKTLLAAIAFATLFAPAVSFAETLKFPSEAPIAEITIPDDWGPEETDSGIQATSADEAIYLAIDIASAKTSDTVIDDAFQFLKDNGVTVNGSTQKRSEDTVNGLAMLNFDWTGTDKDGPVNVGLSMVPVSTDRMLVVTYWGQKGKQEKHADELLAIIGSLKAIKR
ncbi:MAG: histidine kinase [Neorhizobium sp.]|jgi:hypothetical protein|nr:histidine kinase [Neorhizobium sp.]